MIDSCTCSGRGGGIVSEISNSCGISEGVSANEINNSLF